jgi:hypothetical protein
VNQVRYASVCLPRRAGQLAVCSALPANQFPTGCRVLS